MQPLTADRNPASPRPRIGRVLAVLLLLFGGLELFKSWRFRAPDHVDLSALQLQDLSGRPIAANAFAGKAVILNYWAPWCGPCKLEAPWLAEAQRAHPQELLVVGIVDDPQDYADALDVAHRNGDAYPLAQLSPAMQTALGPMHTLPTTLYITRSGSVVHSVQGVVPKVVMDHWIQDAIAKP